MDNAALNDPITNSLAHDILSVLLRIQMELDANVAKGDTRIREGEPPNACFNDILAEADDEGVGVVFFELVSVF
jgi:hypothetical protein